MKRTREIGNSRVTLSHVVTSDAPAILAAFEDQQIARNTLLPEGTHTLQSVKAYVRRLQRLEDSQNGSYWAIRRCSKAELVGLVMLQYVQGRYGCAEVAGWITKSHRRQGLMSESLSLCLQHGFVRLRLKRISARAFAHNDASRGLLHNLSFVHEATLRSTYFRRNRWHDIDVYSILADEWRSRQVRQKTRKRTV